MSWLSSRGRLQHHSSVVSVQFKVFGQEAALQDVTLHTKELEVVVATPSWLQWIVQYCWRDMNFAHETYQAKAD